MRVLLLVMSVASVPLSRVIAAPRENGGSAGQSAQGATLTPAAATAPDIPLSDYDSQAERQLLDLANQARAQAGAPRLTIDAGLCRAARAHAEAMFAARQLSHQFEGEPSLPQRLATATHAQLDQEGENVALDFDAESGHKHLMLSPPHRANLLNAAYNVIGLGVVRNGDRLYIVQDFGHALPNYSSVEVKERIAAVVTQTRRQANQPDLARSDLPNADAAACSMAQADKLGGSAVHQLAQRYTVMTYTSPHPETLPANASHVLAGRNLRSFSLGACYARTETYPTGVYWVVLVFE
ncbi:MAG: CAP domain-containing protein [Candidatus Sulfotelmatobacter sp.]